jgi:ribulose-phosphate 3-epimerase
MTVDLGFGGQKFLLEMLAKIHRLRRLCQTRGFDPFIEVDDGENRESAGQAIEAGATAIVAGSAILGLMIIPARSPRSAMPGRRLP